MKKQFLLLATCAVFLMAGCSSNQVTDTPTETSAPQTDAGTQGDSQTESAAPEETAEPGEEVSSLGDKITVGNWKITAKKASVQKQIKNGKYFYFKPSKGNSYIVISLSVKNTGTEAATFLPTVGYENTMTSTTLYYQDEYEYKPIQLLSYDKDLVAESIQPLTTQKGIIVFEVPKEVGNAKKKDLRLQFKSEGESASYTLK